MQRHPANNLDALALENPEDARREELEVLRCTCQAMARRLEQIEDVAQRIGFSNLLSDREAIHEFETLAIEHHRAEPLMDRYRRDLADVQPATFGLFRGSSMCAAVCIAAECMLIAFRGLVKIDRQGKR